MSMLPSPGKISADAHDSDYDGETCDTEGVGIHSRHSGGQDPV